MAVEAVRIDGQRLSTSFRTLSVHEARALLLYGIERRRPLQLVVGRAGSGKSRLLGALSRTAVAGAELVLVPEWPATFDDTTAFLACRFGVAARPGESPVERLVRVADVLAERRRAGRLVALLLDDAHRLPATTLLDVRLFAGTDADGGALLPIVLAGRPELATALQDPVLDPLRLGVTTHIELRRPLPASIEDAADLDTRSSTAPDGRWRRPFAATVALIGAALYLGTHLSGLRETTRWALPRPHASTAPAIAIVEPEPTRVRRPPADALVDPRLPLPGGRLTAASVRTIVDDLAAALAGRDIVRLEHLLANDARQNGVRGRSAILESYAYRFSRLDASVSIGAPTRITLRGGNALAEVPFDAAYRDAGGNTGRVGGTLQLRVGRHDGRAALDALDWAFVGDTP